MADNEARGLDFRPPGGESPRDVQMRLAPLLAEIEARTVLVTHKGVLQGALRAGDRLDDEAEAAAEAPRRVRTCLRCSPRMGHPQSSS